MKIGIESGEDLRFHLEKDDEGDVIVVDSDGLQIIGLSVDKNGKVYAFTFEDIDSGNYSVKKKGGVIEVIS